MSDPVKPGDYGDWLRAKNIEQPTNVGSIPFDALAPVALTTTFSGSAATALAVAIVAGGAGGPTRGLLDAQSAPPLPLSRA